MESGIRGDTPGVDLPLALRSGRPQAVIGIPHDTCIQELLTLGPRNEALGR